jgi:hypothetical protein
VSGPIVAANGKPTGATGSLTLSGVQDLTDPQLHRDSERFDLRNPRRQKKAMACVTQC